MAIRSRSILLKNILRSTKVEEFAQDQAIITEIFVNLTSKSVSFSVLCACIYLVLFIITAKSCISLVYNVSHFFLLQTLPFIQTPLIHVWNTCSFHSHCSLYLKFSSPSLASPQSQSQSSLQVSLIWDISFDQ